MSTFYHNLGSAVVTVCEQAAVEDILPSLA